MKIDDLADDRTGGRSPGERLHDHWLTDMPGGQWPAYIDECAQLVADGIFIGETNLTRTDFGVETGAYYQKGLARSAGVDLGSTSLPLGRHEAEDIGKVAWAFNRLREQIRTSPRTNYSNPSRAIEAAVNKALVERVETGELDSDELETIRLPDDATVSTLVTEIFCRPRSDVYVDLLVETVQQTQSTSLLEHLDEPRMITQLWEHQAEALAAWLTNDCRGYVDMATATGKTVLGLAAIAHHFGALHPNDRGLMADALRPDSGAGTTVVVVAHRDLILDQWKREFDTHLNIPEQRATRSGEHTATFEWGVVHFWTPNRLAQRGVPDADLVILDETHHYVGSSGFGGLVDEIDGHLLALSGSLDEANARTLVRRGVPKLYEFTLEDGQEAGIIPQCDWDVYLTPYEEQSELVEVTERCRQGFDQYAAGLEIPDDTADAERLTFETLSEARSIAQSNAGRALKEKDPEFRAFASAVMARQLTQYNLSPTLSTVVRLTLDRIDQHKCVVLLETTAEVERVVTELEAKLGDGFESLVTVVDNETDLGVIESFDHEQECGAVVGLARTLGEGVDIQTADVCINRGRGRLSRSLIQRMGRILRNPDGQKHAEFVHVSGLPTQSEAILPREDGVTLLETASQLLAWGEGFDARPVFHLDDETRLTEAALADLESSGATAIDEWTPDHYEWPTDESTRSHLESLCSGVSNTDGAALLTLERPKRERRDSEPRTSAEPSETGGVRFVASKDDPVEVPAWLYELATRAASGSPREFVESAVRTYVQEAWEFPNEQPSMSGEARPVELNPALDAVVLAYAEDIPRNAIVSTALARAILDDADRLLGPIDLDRADETIKTQLELLAGGTVDE
jgi:superfamily II DNA or RNA helicase